MQERITQKRKEKKKKIILFAILILAVIAAASFLLIRFFINKNPNPIEMPSGDAVPSTASTENKVLNPLTGVSGFHSSAVNKRPIALVVENSPQARPQWGLASPDVVIEGLVEGGITRMLWLFADTNDIPKSGPVRSARHDFVEIATGFDAIFAHWGGSPYAYDMIKNPPYVDNLDGMTYSGSYFFRDKSRNVDTEHTAYTNGENLAKLIVKKQYRTDVKDGYKNPFKFEKEESPRTPAEACTSLTLSFSASYNHTFKYSQADKRYYNFMNSSPMNQDGGKQMSVKNVIILYLPFQQIPGSPSIDMDLTGGEGLFVSNGGAQKIKWEKGNSRDNRLRLYDISGAELSLNAGQSYIGLVPVGRQSNTKISALPEEGMQ